jgi:esterase/lipase superfamily enzyme/acyl carrier protein
MGPAGFRICATALIMAVLVSVPGGRAGADAPAYSVSPGQAGDTVGFPWSGRGLVPGRSAVRLTDAAAGDKQKDRYENVLAEVKRAVAEYFGVPVEFVAEATDLVKDLYADPMDAIEVLAQLCDRFDVTFPRRDDLTSVEALAGYISWAKDNTAGGQAPRRAKRGQRRADGPEQTAPKQGETGAQPGGAIYRQTVFFGTDRRVTGESDPNRMFGGERGSAAGLTYGIAEVSIPVSVHKKGQIERPDLFKLELKEDAKRHIVLQRVEPLKREDFVLSLNAFMERKSGSAAGSGDAFVFVHGYNVTFDRAVRRTAQITYDLEFPGAPILFSWPSDGRLLSYLADREDAEWSAPHLETFLNELSEMSKVKRLHLIAHSMGNQALIRALSAIAVKMGNVPEPLFANVILAAPDFDAGAFTDYFAPRIKALSERWTIYASDKDRALDASQVLSVPRLGTPLVVAEGMDTIDASGIDVTPWSVPEFHSYYANKRRMIADLIDVLKGRSPDKRSLVPSTLSGLPYWILGDL